MPEAGLETKALHTTLSSHSCLQGGHFFSQRDERQSYTDMGRLILVLCIFNIVQEGLHSIMNMVHKLKAYEQMNAKAHKWVQRRWFEDV